MELVEQTLKRSSGSGVGHYLEIIGDDNAYATELSGDNWLRIRVAREARRLHDARRWRAARSRARVLACF